MEVKGSDVQNISPMTDEEKRKHAELSEKLRLLFQECSQFRANEMSVYWGIFAYRVNKEIEARIQAAALRARMKQFDEDVNAFGDSITWSQYEREYIIPKRAEMVSQLVALTQPAPEKEKKR